VCISSWTFDWNGDAEGRQRSCYVCVRSTDDRFLVPEYFGCIRRHHNILLGRLSCDFDIGGSTLSSTTLNVLHRSAACLACHNACVRSTAVLTVHCTALSSIRWRSTLAFDALNVVKSRQSQRVDGVSRWFLENGLRLNPAKTEAVLLGNRSLCETLPTTSVIDVAGTVVPFHDRVYYSALTTDQRVTEVVRSGSYNPTTADTWRCQDDTQSVVWLCHHG